MNAEFTSFFIVLSLLWFLVYWVLGGVFFAIMTVMRLGRLRKVRFSCLFSILSLLVGMGAAYAGMKGSQEAVRDCLGQAANNTEKMMALFGCGAASIFGMFLLGSLVLTIGGFLIMIISKSKTKPWIVLDPEEMPEEKTKKSFFES
ncbi:hypothetical protein EPN81_02860 [Patescibacteria group bacterium]|nr:MAG: hypothetical protein EPN81_02860 [Patescibacteria group bacterium]